MSTETTAPMPRGQSSGDIRINLNRVGVVLGVLMGLVALAGAWLVLPYRMDLAERKIEAVEHEQRQQREILIRIDENVKQMKERRP